MTVSQTDPREYLSIELQRLDLMLHREILRLRASYELSLDEFRGLYISDEQVDHLVDRKTGYEGNSSTVEELLQQANALSDISASRESQPSPWRDITARFALTRLESDILLLAAAPEIDLKYETLFAYLNNDVARKYATFDLVERVFGVDSQKRLEVRRCLASQAGLLASALIEAVPPPQDRASWLSTGFRIAPGVAQFLGGVLTLDPRLASFVSLGLPVARFAQLPVSAPQRARLRRLAGLLRTPAQSKAVIVLSGREGSARRLSAEAVSHELNAPIIGVDLEGLWATGDQAFGRARSIVLYQRILGAVLYLERCDALFDRELKAYANARRLVALLSSSGGPVFVSCQSATPWKELFSVPRVLFLQFDDPDYETRLQLWQAAAIQSGASFSQSSVGAVADRFILTPWQINAAVQSAIDNRSLSNDSSDSSSQELSQTMLFDAARSQSDQSLGALATKVKLTHSWDDLVLPPSTLQRVHELSAAIENRHVVYIDWGFRQRLSNGYGLKAVFGGASGTGKTMTASVIARELGLDLYKIDLASVVSKYIGETEKNLDAIFRAAQSSNGILFFDEADALFGKRSEVRDAHDRYANIEVAYLLQRIEEFEGVVILASNLTRNIDDAFTRRMHYVVEFPLPDEKLRERLWRGMFPATAPLSDDVDFSFLAHQFQVTGGDIRNVVLDAAFLAAQDGRLITMRQMVHALTRQMMKQGRVPSPSDFMQFTPLVRSLGAFASE